MPAPPSPAERRRLPRVVPRAGRVLLGLAGVALWAWGMAGLFDGGVDVWHVVAGVGGVAVVILAVAGPARMLQMLFEGLTEGGVGSS